jgi:transposase
MQDNASMHTARVVKALLEELNVQLMVWPRYSPDLNPIENLWVLMKGKIYRLHPELTYAEDTVATQEALVLAAMEAWDNIREEIVTNLCETMPNRVAAIITAEGWYVKY